MKPICLTIAGSDPTSGAGIQADIRTFDRCGVHPFSVITAITYQTATQFFGYKSLSDELDRQLDAILTSYPLKYVKVGMIPDGKTIDIIVDYIKKYDLEVVFDPVSVASAGDRLSSEGLELEIERNLFPHIKIITPNITEALYYSNREINNISEENIDELKKVAEILLNKLYISKNSQHIEKAVVIKSATINQDEIIDLVLINRIIDTQMKREFQVLKKKKIPFNGNIHGTGCVFSSAITAFLARGYSIEEALLNAEDFFNNKFQSFIELPNNGKIIDLTISDIHLEVIQQIKEIYNFISPLRSFIKFIPEVRMNISGALPDATRKEDVAGIEGRITIVNGFPKVSGEIKFGVSDHTARLILSAKEYDNSINFVINLKYKADWITVIKKKTDLELKEIVRKDQPEEIKTKLIKRPRLKDTRYRNTCRHRELLYSFVSSSKLFIISPSSTSSIFL